jgi:uncharacterized Rmd1/YagE family protein
MNQFPTNGVESVAVIVAAAITALSNYIIAKRVAAVKDKIDLVDQKADVIHGVVNSAATAQDVKVAQLEKDVVSLKQLLMESKERAQLLAQSNAIEKSQSPIIIGERRKNDS